tara:strand:+ start:1463 stop:1630 length:168 start_codon:yes stop_codon:yes gene_type:complete
MKDIHGFAVEYRITHELQRQPAQLAENQNGFLSLDPCPSQGFIWPIFLSSILRCA